MTRRASRRIAPNAEGEDRPEATVEVLLGTRVGRIAGKAGILHACHLRVRFEKLRDREGVAAMALDAQAQRFEALEQKPGVERGERRTHVAQQLHARL